MARAKIAIQFPEAPTLQQELLTYQVTIDETTAQDSYDARVGQPDDLVLALCLAMWAAEHSGPVDLW